MPAAFFPCVILHGAGAFYPSSGGRDRRRGGKARRGQRARGSDENCGSSRCCLCRIQAGDHGRGTQVGKLRVTPAGEATGPRRRSHCEGRREAPRGPPGGEQTLPGHELPGGGAVGHRASCAGQAKSLGGRLGLALGGFPLGTGTLEELITGTNKDSCPSLTVHSGPGVSQTKSLLFSSFC